MKKKSTIEVPSEPMYGSQLGGDPTGLIRITRHDTDPEFEGCPAVIEMPREVYIKILKTEFGICDEDIVKILHMIDSGNG